MFEHARQRGGQIASCNLANELCGQADSIELSGAIACNQISQNAEGEYCSSSVDCTQSGTIDGVDVKVHGDITTDCLDTGDTWLCNCFSGNLGKSITLEKSGATPWDECTAASEACQDAIGVQFDQSGGVLPPLPRPL